MGQSLPLFVYFRSFHIPIQVTNIQFELFNLCLGLELGAAGWKAVNWIAQSGEV